MTSTQLESANSSDNEQQPTRITEIAEEDQKNSSKHTRKGKWTLEEEDYVSALISQFDSGCIDIPEGTTLRAYLAEKLNCDPMRITKKFTGQDCLGKRVSISLPVLLSRTHQCDKSVSLISKSLSHQDHVNSLFL